MARFRLNHWRCWTSSRQSLVGGTQTNCALVCRELSRIQRRIASDCRLLRGVFWLDYPPALRHGTPASEHSLVARDLLAQNRDFTGLLLVFSATLLNGVGIALGGGPTSVSIDPRTLHMFCRQRLGAGTVLIRRYVVGMLLLRHRWY